MFLKQCIYIDLTFKGKIQIHFLLIYLYDSLSSDNDKSFIEDVLLHSQISFPSLQCILKVSQTHKGLYIKTIKENIISWISTYLYLNNSLVVDFALAKLVDNQI